MFDGSDAEYERSTSELQDLWTEQLKEWSCCLLNGKNMVGVVGLGEREIRVCIFVFEIPVSHPSRNVT